MTELATFLEQGQGLAPATSEQGLGPAPVMNSLWGDGTGARASVVSMQGLGELRDSLPLYDPPTPTTTTTTAAGDNPCCLILFLLLLLCTLCWISSEK